MAEEHNFILMGDEYDENSGAKKGKKNKAWNWLMGKDDNDPDKNKPEEPILPHADEDIVVDRTNASGEGVDEDYRSLFGNTGRDRRATADDAREVPDWLRDIADTPRRQTEPKDTVYGDLSELLKRMGAEREPERQEIVLEPISTKNEADKVETRQAEELLEGLRTATPEDAGLNSNSEEIIKEVEKWMVEEQGENKASFESVKDDLKKLSKGGKERDDWNENVKLLRELKDEKGVDLFGVENILFNGNDPRDYAIGSNNRLRISTAAEVVESGSVEETSFKNVKEARDYLESLGVRFEEGEKSRAQVETPKKEVETVETRINKVIRAHEEEFINLFFADYSREALGANVEGLNRLAGVVIESDKQTSDLFEEYVNKGKPEEMLEDIFESLQQAYLKHVLGEDALTNMLFEKGKIERWEDKIKRKVQGFDDPAQKRGLEILRNTNKGKLTRNLFDISTKRNWEDGYYLIASEFLNKKFNFVERGSDDKSELGRVTGSLFGYFSSENFVKYNVDRTKWSENDRLLFESVLNLHDFALTVNGSKPPEKEIREDLITSIDADIKRVINIKNKDGNLVIPTVIEIYDRVLRDFSDSNPEKPTKIDDPLIKTEVENRLKLSGLGLNDTEIKMMSAVGRSLSGMMGIDAQYYYAKKRNDENKFESLPYGSKGVLMNEAFNIVNIEFPNNPRIPKEALRSIKLGVVPFVNMLNGSENYRSEPFSGQEIYNKIMRLPIGTEYQNWISSVMGASAAAKAERKVLIHISDPIGQLKAIMSEYNYKGPGKPAYVLTRMKDIVNAFLDARRKMPVKDVKTTEFLSSLNSEFGLFADDDTLNDYLTSEGLPKKDDADEEGEAKKILSGWYGNKAKVDFTNSGKAQAYYKNHPFEAFTSLLRR